MDTVNIDTVLSAEQEFREKFHTDFSKKVDSFPDKYMAKLSFEESTGLSSKTFDRYYSKKTVPAGDNIITVYSYIHGNCDKVETFNLLNNTIKNLYLSQMKTKVTNIPYSNIVNKSPIHHRIYVMTMNGNTIFSKDFVSEWGLQGEKAINEMLGHNLITEITNGVFAKGSARSSFSHKEILSHSDYLINNSNLKNLLKEDILGNSLDFHTLNLSEEGLEKLQKAKIDYINLIYSIEEEFSGDIQLATCIANCTINKDWRSDKESTKEVIQ